MNDRRSLEMRVVCKIYQNELLVSRRTLNQTYVMLKAMDEMQTPDNDNSRGDIMT
jgi:hypothetical protein